MNHVTCKYVFLKWNKFKRPKTPLPSQLKTKLYFSLSLTCVCVSAPLPQIKIIFGITTTPALLFLEASISGLHLLDNLQGKKWSRFPCLLQLSIFFFAVHVYIAGNVVSLVCFKDGKFVYIDDIWHSLILMPREGKEDTTPWY